MRTDELALDYIDRAELTLEEAKRAFEKEVYSLAIRRAQETCELSLKGALRYLAIEYPRNHDVSDVLIRVKEIRQIPEVTVIHYYLASASSFIYFFSNSALHVLQQKK